ncbi:MAG TPA: hypothetical protein VIL01_01975 [Thermomicrobiales bacterium]
MQTKDFPHWKDIWRRLGIGVVSAVVTPGIFAWLLPRPPTPDGSEGTAFDTMTVALIIIVVLGIVSLLALALRPLVAERLGGQLQLSATEGNGQAESRGPRPFTPPVAATAHGDIDHVDVATQETLRGLIRKLLAHANAGEYRAGLALYTPDYQRRFIRQSGMTTEELMAALESSPPRPPEEHSTLAAVDRFERLPDGRVTAVARYHQQAGPPPPPERYIFAQLPTGEWRIDDIQPA